MAAVRKTQGFTLIELSIVLVIIGLIIGGVLVGQELISAATARATIAQIEKYNTAANTFYTKYGYLPGDIPNPYAGQFGLLARGNYAGEGDGDGAICGVTADAPNSLGFGGGVGEAAMFWRDMSTVGLIEGGYNLANPVTLAYIPPVSFSNYMPPAKLGNGNYIYVWCTNAQTATNEWAPTPQNYFGIESMVSIWAGLEFAAPGITVAQAYNIDKKIDDGLPQSGIVLAYYTSEDWGTRMMWSAGGYPNSGGSTGSPQYAPSTTATPSASYTCYDNGGVGGTAQKYSMEINNGSNPNCGLSFKMQGAAR